MVVFTGVLFCPFAPVFPVLRNVLFSNFVTLELLAGAYIACTLTVHTISISRINMSAITDRFLVIIEDSFLRKKPRRVAEPCNGKR